MDLFNTIRTDEIIVCTLINFGHKEIIFVKKVELMESIINKSNIIYGKIIVDKRHIRESNKDGKLPSKNSSTPK